MRLGFYYHIPALRKENAINMPGYLGRFLDSLAEYCQELILFQHLPNPDENANLDYCIRSPNVKLVSLPQRGSLPHRLLHTQNYTRILKQYLNDLDALLIRGPTPLLPAMAKAASSSPTILLLIGDYRAGVNALPQPTWRKELIRLWAWLNERGQLRAAKKSLVFVNSQRLYQKYRGKIKSLKETRTTTLLQKDFFRREDTCQTRPIRLLYTGRIDPAKGLLELVEALGFLVQQGQDIVLDLVGWPEKGTNILSQVNESAYRIGVEDRVIYHGYKPVGPELFAYYKNADIYIIASQSSEGFPRTIWEAMAHSLPVIATRVGSIPDFIEDAAVLVPPKNPKALAEGIKNLINHPELRKNHILKGFSLASENTLEVQVGEMTKIIQLWLKGQHG